MVAADAAGNAAVLVAIVTGGLLFLGTCVTAVLSYLGRGDRKATSENRAAVAKASAVVAEDRQHVDATTRNWLSILEDVTIRLQDCIEGREHDAAEKATHLRELNEALEEIRKLRRRLEERDAG